MLSDLQHYFCGSFLVGCSFIDCILVVMGTKEDTVFNIEKLDGTNFSYWKDQIWDVLVQKKQIRPLKLNGVKPENMEKDDWDELDEMCRSTIRLSLSKSVYYNVKDAEGGAYELWQRICDMYDKHSAASQVYWIKKLIDLRMEEGASMNAHLNEFNTIFSQLTTQKIIFEDNVKAMFLLVTLPDSWDTFRTAISNSVPAGELTSTNVESSLLTEEINQKNNAGSKSSSAMAVRGRSMDRHKSNRGKSRSKSRTGTSKRDVECFYCGKKGHYKKDCYKWKREHGDGKKKDKDDAKDKGKSNVKIEELNATQGECSSHDDHVCAPISATSEELGDVLLASSFDDAFLLTHERSMPMDWVIDSGASFHVTPHRSWFHDYDASRTGTVRIADGRSMQIHGIGDIHLAMPNSTTFVLHRVRHVPALAKSLISVGQLDSLGFNVSFGDGGWKLTKGSLVLAKGAKRNTLYSFCVSSIVDHIVGITEQPPVSLWHQRLGHMSLKGMKLLARADHIPVSDFTGFDFCEHCLYGRHARSSHKKNVPRRLSEKLALVHSDVCGPMPNASLGGAMYFVTFIDDASRKVWAYPIRKKDMVFDVFKQWVALVETQTGCKLKCLRTDNGGEFMSHAFTTLCAEKGIRRELSAPYTPPQNGVAERMNRTIQEKVRSMLSMAGLLDAFWAEAVMTAVHLINRSPSVPLGFMVPEEVWTGLPPSYGHLRVFGCEAYVHVLKEKRSKLDPKSKRCVFLGYGDSGEMGYRLWDPTDRKIVRSHDVVFHEDSMYRAPPRTVEVRRVIFEEDGHRYDGPMVARRQPIDPHVGDHADVGQQDAPPPQVLRRSERRTRPPHRYVPSMDYVMLTDCGEPSCYDEAMSSVDKLKWEQAMQSEMDSLIQNGTWKLTPLPKGKKALPCKWVYKVKLSPADGTPRYKARLVAKGFKQQQGIDFDEIFSPVVKMTTLRTVLALVAREDLELVQLDVKTAFLHGDLHEDLYMEQPAGFVAHGSEDMVCSLRKSLYGLKQAPREWYQKFDAFMRSEGYMRSHEDPCLYTRKAADGSLIVLILYVDDMLIAGKSVADVNALKHRLHETFAMKDLGDASHILGMRITRDRSCRLLFLSQKEYIDRVLERFHMEGGKAISTPLPPYAKLSHDDCPQTDVETAEMSRIPYASAVGSLMYAMVATRPDLAHAVGVVSRYMSNPGKRHWDAVRGILRYLRGTSELSLCYGEQDMSVRGYVDSYYAGSVDSRKSTSGYVFTLAGGPVSWASRIQPCVALSTTEAEYMAATHRGC